MAFNLISEFGKKMDLILMTYSFLVNKNDDLSLPLNILDTPKSLKVNSRDK